MISPSLRDHGGPNILLFILLLLNLKINPTSAQGDENAYCGSNWLAAAAACSNACPNQLDSECTNPGEKCQQWTGCKETLANSTPEPTGNPIITTRRPTLSPTAIPSSQPTLSIPPTVTPPTGFPTGTPSIWRPDLFSVATLQQDERGESTIFSTTSQRSYGVIFEVQTTPDSPAISITTFEFYCPLKNANVAYEVWTKPGTWHGFEGRERRFTKIAAGNVTTSNLERGLTRIPRGRVTPIELDGGGARQSIYITLTSKHMLYAHSTTGTETVAIESIEQAQSATEDTIVLLSTQELIVYEGAAVMAYPFQKAAQRLFYRMPRGFVGRIWYLRRPCKELPVTITNEEDGSTIQEFQPVTRWADCVGLRPPGIMPTRVQAMPSSFLVTSDENLPADGGSSFDDGGVGVGGGNWTNGTAPTTNPTISAMPTIDTMKVNLILIIQNPLSSEIMNSEQMSAFEEMSIEFFDGRQLLELNEVELYGAKVWYQQVLVEGGEDEEEPEQRLLQDATIVDGISPNNNEATANTNSAESTNANTKTVEEDEYIPVTISLEVTLVISVLYSPLPQQITQDLLQNLLINNVDDFTELIKRNPTLNPNFKTIDGIPSILAVEKVTLPPTLQPTDMPTIPVSVLASEEPTPIPTWVYTVTIFGLIYALLIIASFSYVKRFRDRMQIERDQNVDGRMGGGNANVRVGHGMRYGSEKDDQSAYSRLSRMSRKSKKKNKKSEKTASAAPSRGFFKSFSQKNLKKNSKEKNMMDDRAKANLLLKMSANGDMGMDQNDDSRELYSLDEENEGDNMSSYFSEEDEDEEEVSSMEDSYYSEDESDYSTENSN
mmetsp:Transcript_23750/g.51332  ORF Transcript_23750/g.51332 Transcript_23750/m.51332 type:complete len:832 (-) Transcript_23750:789-3284(-)